jgi:hypothetical protein
MINKCVHGRQKKWKEGKSIDIVTIMVKMINIRL